jgi:hypothetical protein
MNRRFLITAVPVGGILIALAACGGHNASGVPVSARLSSDSAQASAAASAASELATRCQPKGETVQQWEVRMLLKSTREAFYSCEAIPKGDYQAVGACVLTAAENAHKAGGSSASKETGFISALAACISSLGATPSASASGTAG